MSDFRTTSKGSPSDAADRIVAAQPVSVRLS